MSKYLMEETRKAYQNEQRIAYEEELATFNEFENKDESDEKNDKLDYADERHALYTETLENNLRENVADDDQNVGKSKIEILAQQYGLSTGLPPARGVKTTKSMIIPRKEDLSLNETSKKSLSKPTAKMPIWKEVVQLERKQSKKATMTLKTIVKTKSILDLEEKKSLQSEKTLSNTQHIGVANLHTGISQTEEDLGTIRISTDPQESTRSKLLVFGSPRKDGTFLTSMNRTTEPMESDSDFKPAEAFNKGVDFIPNDESDSEEASVQLANKRGEGGSPSQVRRNTSGPGDRRKTTIIQSLRPFRQRAFDIKFNQKLNLFEGIPYVQYGTTVLQVPGYQNVIFRDLLKVLLDKCNSVRNFFQESASLAKIMKHCSEGQKKNINCKIEETVGLIRKIGSKILQEFQESIQKIGIHTPPDISALKITNKEEEELMKENIAIYNGTLDYLRDSVDCYFVMCRQKDRKPLNDETCLELFQFITRARFNAGELVEEFRIIEKSIDETIHWNKEMEKKIRAQEEQEDHHKGKTFTHKDLVRSIRTERLKQKGLNPKDFANRADYELERTKKLAILLNKLLQNKFNFKSKFQTRESKVQLKLDEEEKNLNLLKEKKNIEKHRPVADNRNIIRLNSLLNPISGKEMQSYLKMARSIGSLNVDRELADLMNIMPTEPNKNKAQERRNLELLTAKLKGLLEQPKIQHNTLSVSDKEKDFLYRKMDEDTMNSKEVLVALLETKRHATCVLDDDIIQLAQVQKTLPRTIGMRSPRLPTLKNSQTTTNFHSARTTLKQFHS